MCTQIPESYLWERDNLAYVDNSLTPWVWISPLSIYLAVFLKKTSCVHYFVQKRSVVACKTQLDTAGIKFSVELSDMSAWEIDQMDEANSWN